MTVISASSLTALRALEGHGRPSPNCRLSCPGHLRC